MDISAAQQQYEEESGFPSDAAESASTADILQYAQILKSRYLTTEPGAELSAIVDLLHDDCAVEQLISRCFADRDSLVDHLNDFIQAASAHADTMAMRDAYNADRETIQEAL